MKLISFALAVTLLLINSSFSAFSVEPAISETSDSTIITFSVPEAIDVEVAVLDYNGKIVRHLAAGVLGGQFPPPLPLKPGLSQRLAWDRKNDNGQPVFGNSEIRIRAGVKPVYNYSFSVAPEMIANNKQILEFPSKIIKKTDGTDSIVPTRRYNRIIDTARYLSPQTDFIEIAHPFFHYWRKPYIPQYEERNNFDLEVSDQNDEIIVKGHNPYEGGDHRNALFFRYNGTNGKYYGKTSFLASNFTIGSLLGSPGWSEPILSWDGAFVHYASNISNSGFRFTLSGQPASWPGTNSNAIQWDTSFIANDLHNLGHAPGPDGSHYFISYRKTITTYYPAYSIMKIKDGTISKIVDSIECAPSGGIQIDAKGNIYLAAVIKPNGKTVPDDISIDSLNDTQIPPYITPTDTPLAYQAKAARNLTIRKAAKELIGSIIKISPNGGILKKTTNSSARYVSSTNTGQFYIQDSGVEWIHYGVSHVLTHSGVAACHCNQIRFDVDRFGRVYYPNTFQHEFCAIDNNRNYIFRIKSRDLQGITISMAHQIRQTDNGLYVTDMYRNRIVVFKWAADDEKTFSLSLKAEEKPSLLRTAKINLMPNPANPATRISLDYGMEKMKGFTLKVYNAAGREVADLTSALTSSNGTFVWNASGFATGIYTMKACVPGHTLVRNLLVLK